MSDKKKGKQRKVEEEAPTKEEYAVAKYLRFGLPVREGKLHGMEVKCFFGNAAVDKLMESKWSSANNKKDPLFTNRVSCVSYLLGLLQKGLFHRAEREKRKKDKDKEKADKSKKKKKEKDGEKEEAVKPDEELRERKGKKDKKGKKEKVDAEGNGDEAEKKETDKQLVEKKEEKEKKKKEKRLKLVMPEEQFFEDSEEVYVWIYDPVNAKTFFIGLLMVLGAIGLCMFPLWPEEVRVGVYYLSLSAAGFVGFILFLVVVRLVLFCLVWMLTLGVHHFWFLPNLTEDVGFFDSFKPLYHHEKVTGETKAKEESKKKKKKKKEEGDIGEEEKDTEKKEKSSDKDDSDEFEVIKSEDVVEQDAEDNDEENVDNDEADNTGLEDEDEEDNQEEENGDSEEEEEEEEEEENSETLEKKKSK